MAEYRLSVRARLQLLDIYEFTTAIFGQYQAEAYHAGLERTFSLLADFPRIGQLVDELGTGAPPFPVPIALHLLHGGDAARPDPRDLSLCAGHQAAAFRSTDDNIPVLPGLVPSIT